MPPAANIFTGNRDTFPRIKENRITEIERAPSITKRKHRQIYIKITLE
jgi:hypothetical protein